MYQIKEKKCIYLQNCILIGKNLVASSRGETKYLYLKTIVSSIIVVQHINTWKPCVQLLGIKFVKMLRVVIVLFTDF